MVKKIAATALLAIAALVVGGIAWASIPGPDGVIHGCYKTSNPAQGAVIVVDHTASCPSGYAALNWNQTGPQGPAGANGVSGYEMVQATVTIGANSNGQASASCPTDKVATGGGHLLTSTGAANAHVYISRPFSSGNTWQWDVVVTNGNGFSIDATAYVLCASAS